ncbi:MAG: hypothetical protein HYW07_16150 [Candidatus Latescibacteria bacterium]|nr:hypothetical protein [Candidatus Latescibacterota bacterium]
MASWIKSSRAAAQGMRLTLFVFFAILPSAAIAQPDLRIAGKIAFMSFRTGNGDIYAMNADGTGVTQLTDDPAFDSDPS